MKTNFILIWIGVGILLVFFWVYFPTLSRYRDLKIEEDRISRELADLDQKIQALQEERNLLKNDVEYLEKVIRRELGLVKPGEMVYRFVPEESKPKTEPQPQIAPEMPVEVPASEPVPIAEEASYPREETR